MHPTDPFEELVAIKAALRLSDYATAEDAEKIRQRAFEAVVALDDWCRQQIKETAVAPVPNQPEEGAIGPD